MANSKICCACKKDQPLTEFWNDKNQTSGKVARCKTCIRNKVTLHPWAAPLNHHTGPLPKRTPKDKEPEINEEIDFDFLADFKRTSKFTWSVSQAKLLLLKIGEAKKANVINYDKIFEAYGSGHKKNACLQLLAEIRKLALANRDEERAGRSKEKLEDYWNGSLAQNKIPRRFKFGNQVLAPEKKRGPYKKKS